MTKAEVNDRKAANALHIMTKPMYLIVPITTIVDTMGRYISKTTALLGVRKLISYTKAKPLNLQRVIFWYTHSVCNFSILGQVSWLIAEKYKYKKTPIINNNRGL